MLYVLCVEVLGCKISASQNIEGFLFPGARGLQFKVSQYADDTTAFVKSENSLYALFDVITDFEHGSGAQLNRSKRQDRRATGPCVGKKDQDPWYFLWYNRRRA